MTDTIKVTLSNENFEEDPPRKPVQLEDESERLLLQIDGYEGPIDALLDLARSQKVDLRHVSILQLVRQYLTFIDRAKELRLELAAEYLVMAAWLAYLKSRLLLPQQEDDEEELTGEQMAEALQFQLRRLEAMQNAGEILMSRPQLGVDTFARGAPERIKTKFSTEYEVGIFDLLQAYGSIERRRTYSEYKLENFHLMSTEDAVSRMTTMLGNLPRKGPYSVWATLDSFLPDKTDDDPLFTRSALASLFTAGLEMAKQGTAEIKQDGLFRPIYLREKLQAREEA